MTGEISGGRDRDVLDATLTALVLANKILAREDVIDDFAHVSVRHPLDPERYFLSRSRNPAAVTRADIMEFTLDGEQVGDDRRRPYADQRRISRKRRSMEMWFL